MLALSPQEAQALRDLGLSLDYYAGYQVGLDIYSLILLISLAGLIFWRRSYTWLGFLLSLALVFFGTITALNVVALVRPYPSLNLPFLLLEFLASMLLVLLFYLFPDGRFVPRWTRLIVIALPGGVLINLLLPIGGPLAQFVNAGLEILWLGSLLVGLFAQIYRYQRVSTATQRQQTKWIMFGLIAVIISTLIWLSLLELFPLQSSSTRLALKLSFGIAVLLYTIFPISVVFSILRYRLWDIDILINRTLVYTLLTAVLVAVYFATVVLLQSLLRSMIGQESPLAIVASTLLIAALFTPLRRRLQELIDRRFYRSKYDAERMLARFAVSARDEVELEVLAAALINVVKESMQPAASSLWLAPSQRPAENRRVYRDNRDTDNLIT